MKSAVFSELSRALVDNYQRQFPLCHRPFEKIGRQWGVSESAVFEALHALDHAGALSRIGPVFDHHRAGASTLAAMAVPAGDIEQVAQQVNAFAEVNHNYEREHQFNLWFVVAAPDQFRLKQTLRNIEHACGYPVMSLPMVKGFHIDLGFPVDWGQSGHTPFPTVSHSETRLAVVQSDTIAAASGLSEAQQTKLKSLIQGGVPVVSSPYAQLAESVGATEFGVMMQIQLWQESGLIKRFGLVIKHRAIGYRANAMVVWNVPDADLESVAAKLAKSQGVTLCYQRPRVLPQWPYNLFCMIHGRNRTAVIGQLDAMVEQCQLQYLDKEILFSSKAFKQCGARYFHNDDEKKVVA